MKEKAQRRRVSWSKKRTMVCAVVFIAAVLVVIAHAGTGNYSAFGWDSIALLCPLGSLEVLLASKTAIPRVVLSLGVLVLATALIGKAFCAWICPSPHISSWFSRKKARGNCSQSSQGNRLSSEGCAHCSHRECRASVALPPVGGKRDGLQLDSRHLVLGGALTSAALFGFPVFCLICPIGITFATIIAVWQLFGLHEPSWMLLVFPAILLVELVVFKRWCHSICPLGALLSLLSQKAPLFKPVVDSDRCLRAKGEACTACVNACPEKLDPHSSSLGECTRCGVCIDACPVGAVSFRKRLLMGKRNGEESGMSPEDGHANLSGNLDPVEECGWCE